MSGIDYLIKSSFSEFKENIELAVERNCKTFCRNLLKEAIQKRETATGKHDFTGNFLNSIVVCLYKKGLPLSAYYASNETKSAVVVKMTFPKKYVFKKDYEGANSHYNPKIQTDEGMGAYDARMFFASYKPDGNNMFDIVVAYPVEYAEFIEIQRGTAGFMQTLQYVDRIGITFLQI